MLESEQSAGGRPRSRQRCHRVEGGGWPARFRPVESLNGPAELFGHRRRHLRQTSKTEWLDTTALGLPLPTIQWPATALIEGLQWDNSIGPRKRACILTGLANFRAVDYTEAIANL
jgi:hypothetical protein